MIVSLISEIERMNAVLNELGLSISYFDLENGHYLENQANFHFMIFLSKFKIKRAKNIF